MSKSFTISRTIVAGIFISVIAFAGIAFAAIQLSVTQQSVKTLHATFTYQDIVAAPSYQGDSSQKFLKIVNIPANTEILSAYFKVNTIFTESEFPNGTLGVFSDGALALGLVTGYLHSDVGIRNVNDAYYTTPVFDQPKELGFHVSGSGDMNNLTSGEVEIYVNYLKH